MEIIISKTKSELGKKASIEGAGLIRKAIQKMGQQILLLPQGHLSSKC